MKVFELGKIEKEYLSVVGGKARGLDNLVREGFCVPPGFVLVDVNLETDTEAAFQYYINSGLKKVAVRSSASSEDGADFSFAGQFATVLNVDSKERFIDALRKDIGDYDEQYIAKLSINPVTSSMITNKCGYCGDICTGGGFGYYYKHPHDKIVSRCGAYPIIIPDIKKNDIDELKRVILEQHNYFLSIT